MARIRSIKPGFFLSEQLASLSFEWRLLFAGLWTQADRAGRLEDRPQRLKASLFPYDPVDIDDGLKRLAEAGLIVRYEVGNQRLIEVPTWAKHQQPHVREVESDLPAPKHVTSRVPASGQHSRSRSRSRSGSGKGADPEKSSEPRAASEPPLLVFPVVGTGGTDWPLSAHQVAEWRGLFPALDILAEARKALAWVRANPGRRKTATGMPKFLVNWFNRAVDRGGSTGTQRPAAQPRRVAGSTLHSAAVNKYAGIERHDDE